MNHRRHGKIARLPRETRETVNQMLDDGATYPQIIRKLQALGYANYNPKNLQHWKEGGYQEWVRARERDQFALKQNVSLLAQVMHDPNHPTSLAYTATVLGLSQMAQVFQRFDPETLQQRLEEDPMRYFGLIRALSQLVKDKLALDARLAESGGKEKFARICRGVREVLQEDRIANRVAQDDAEDEGEQEGAEGVEEKDAVEEQEEENSAPEQVPNFTCHSTDLPGNIPAK